MNASRLANSATLWLPRIWRDPQRGLEESCVGVLEQVAAGQGFEDLEQRHAVMAVGRETRTRDHGLGLAGEDGNLREAPAMDGRGEEADKDPNPGNPSAPAERLYHHRVEMNRPVDRRTAVRLGDRNQMRPVAIGGGLRRSRAVLPAGEHAARRIAQDPEPVGARRGQPRPPAPHGETMLAVADEGESAVCQPAQERPGLGDLVFHGRRWVLVQPGDGIGETVPHRFRVLDRRADISEHGFQPFAQRLDGTRPA